MSTATLPGRGRAAAPARTQPGRQIPRRPRPPVRAVPTRTAPARAPFVVAVVMLLSLGLGALLLLNTLLAQGSFTLHTLNDRVGSLVDREQALQQRASELAAPQRLARQAQKLGMVASQNPAFLRASDGKILGEPVPAAAQIEPTPVVGSSDPATTGGSSTGNGDDSGGDKSNTGDQGKTDQGKTDQGKNDGGHHGGADQ
ncbi:MAG: hypothetical protein ACJ72Y_01825 [Actinomycetes bacterium]